MFPSAERGEERGGKKKEKRNTRLQQMSKMVEALQEREGAVGCHTQNHNGASQSAHTHINTHIGHTKEGIRRMHYTSHTNKQHRQPLCYHDTNALRLESISQKTSDTNGNHISGRILTQKRRRGPWWNPFSPQKINNTVSISIISYNWREKKAFQPCKQTYKKKVSGAAGEAVAIWAA